MKKGIIPQTGNRLNSKMIFQFRFADYGKKLSMNNEHPLPEKSLYAWPSH